MERKPEAVRICIVYIQLMYHNIYIIYICIFESNFNRIKSLIEFCFSFSILQMNFKSYHFHPYLEPGPDLVSNFSVLLHNVQICISLDMRRSHFIQTKQKFFRRNSLNAFLNFFVLMITFALATTFNMGGINSSAAVHYQH